MLLMKILFAFLSVCELQAEDRQRPPEGGGGQAEGRLARC
jgi:hypothetical protein